MGFTNLQTSEEISAWKRPRIFTEDRGDMSIQFIPNIRLPENIRIRPIIRIFIFFPEKTNDLPNIRFESYLNLFCI